ncbi:hypothetical protein H257_18292 [Aphanomyces astaci]|uniref:Uncharacterized protein n=1 Tax=Aphanomyces astaci TaxID=112090 RepID=W4FBN2_APHAT|nr:hypothetical protein H257_18292 [Aphanomyces astaci]ETV64897.1 hypothetical protein H257_18292 [Aphanomyces astaci]|eukprot:XP_009845625.1 hypothetical protein H257_18292 [Aphanomyces astaci]
MMHCLYGYFFLGIKKSHLAVIYRKDEKIIANWVQRYNDTETYSRKNAPQTRTFKQYQKDWLIAYYQGLSFLDEAKKAFLRKSIVHQHFPCFDDPPRVQNDMESDGATSNAKPISKTYAGS